MVIFFRTQSISKSPYFFISQIEKAQFPNPIASAMPKRHSAYVNLLTTSFSSKFFISTYQALSE